VEDRKPEAKALLRQTLGFRDVVLYLVTAGVNLQWVATAAAAGPSVLGVWVLGFLSMSLPLALCVVHLSSRYPQEGGMYVWSQRAFGDFAAFMTGWTYWTSNIPYLPGVLYFAAGNALSIAGGRFRHLSASPAYFIVASLLGLALGTGVNIVGLQIGKHLTNLGAHARFLAVLMLMAMGALAWARFGPASSFDRAAIAPGIRFKDLVFWSTIAFALTGFESASFMGDEIRDARRTIPRAIFASAPIVLLVYLLGTASVLIAIPPGEVSGLQGVIDAVISSARRLGLPALVPIGASLITLSALGGVGAWLGSTARLPFVAGIDRYLPEGFGRVHPRWRTPHVSLWTMAIFAGVCVLLGQAGTTVKGAYDILVSMTVISVLIPFLFLYGSAIRLQREPAGPGVVRIPGGKPAIILVASIGLVTTAASIALSIVPAPDEPRPAIAVAKVVGLSILNVGLGAALFVIGRRRQRGVGRRP
jgi:glutamate:GABA antiporter